MAYKDIRLIGNDNEADRLLNRVFLSHLRPAYVEIGEDNFCLPIAYKNFAERIHKFKIRDDDVFLAAHPRTGTTWSAEMIWLINNNFDYEGAKENVELRCQFFDFQSLFGDHPMFREKYKEADSLQQIDALPSPRFIRTHLIWYLLPEDITSGKKRPKIISVLRNPKDTCVSLYHQSRLVGGYKGTFDEFCELFLAGRVAFGSFWKSVLSLWKRRDQLDILFIRYKDMKDNLTSVIKQVAAFLGKDITEEQVQRLAEHLSFENMKKNPAVNKEDVFETFVEPLNIKVSTENTFIRQGIQDGYTAVMSKQFIEKFDAWTKENFESAGLVVE